MTHLYLTHLMPLDMDVKGASGTVGCMFYHLAINGAAKLPQEMATKENAVKSLTRIAKMLMIAQAALILLEHGALHPSLTPQK